MKQQTRRPILVAVAGFFMCAFGVFLLLNLTQSPNSIPLSQKYTYQINQSATGSARYTQNNFFESNGSPGVDNTVYVAALTEYLESSLEYQFTGSETTELQYEYKADAVVRSTFSGKDTNTDAANVWNKRYTLLEPVRGVQTTRDLKLDPNVRVPFAEYAETANEFRMAYNIPTGTEVVVTYIVTVRGEAYGTPFTNTQTASVVAPLDQPLYKVDVKFNKTDYQEVASSQSWQLQDIVSAYQIPFASVLILVGFVLVLYGFRKQIIKSPYQRELSRIYRYNSDVIVKARRPVSLAHKTIVDLDTFDDLLNIEEETGLPIVANEINNSVTRFIIAHDDTVYVHTLGGKTPSEDWGTQPSTLEDVPKSRPIPVERRERQVTPKKLIQ